jgi:hypothetical protein
MRDVIEHEYLLFIARLYDELVFVLLGEVDAFRESILWLFWLQTHYYFDLLLSVYTTVSTHIYNIIQIFSAWNNIMFKSIVFNEEDCFLFSILIFKSKSLWLNNKKSLLQNSSSYSSILLATFCGVYPSSCKRPSKSFSISQGLWCFSCSILW